MDEKLKLNDLDFHDCNGSLLIALEQPDVERVVRLLQRESDSPDLADVDPSDIHRIVIEEVSARNRRLRAQRGWKDRIALVTCGVVAFAFLFVFVIGLAAIVGLVPLPR